jgi:hypothetical protein
MMASTAAGSILAVLVVCLGMVSAPAGSAAAAPCPSALVEAIPARMAKALSGSEFVRRTDGVSAARRETVIEAELLEGNLPDFLKRLRPVTMQGRINGRTTSVTICVMPDYLAVGTDHDFLRLPMALPTALTIADRFGFVLPTPKMVDAIYGQSDVQLQPQPLPPGDAMRSTGYYWRHERRIREQRRTLDAPLGALISGQKKDLVLSNRLLARPDRVAIYGWHQASGQPIQPLSTVHGVRYADYSHGVRLVSIVAYVDGQPRSVLDLLEDPKLAPLLSDEGPVPGVVALMSHASGQRMLAAIGASSAADGDGGCTSVC